MSKTIDKNVKPSEMSNLYWDYLKGRIEVEDMSQDQFNQIVIEQYNGYKSRGGKDTFKEFITFIEENGL